MKIEVVAFYPSERNDAKGVLNGTLHIYLVDFDLEIRGINVFKKKDFWHFRLPARSAVDAETNGLVKYPVVSFADARKTGALLEEIKTKGREYIENKLQMELDNVSKI